MIIFPQAPFAEPSFFSDFANASNDDSDFSDDDSDVLPRTHPTIFSRQPQTRRRKTISLYIYIYTERDEERESERESERERERERRERERNAEKHLIDIFFHFRDCAIWRSRSWTSSTRQAPLRSETLDRTRLSLSPLRPLARAIADLLDKAAASAQRDT